jgi:hypothetical protein
MSHEKKFRVTIYRERGETDKECFTFDTLSKALSKVHQLRVQAKYYELTLTIIETISEVVICEHIGD